MAFGRGRGRNRDRDGRTACGYDIAAVNVSGGPVKGCRTARHGRGGRAAVAVKHIITGAAVDAVVAAVTHDSVSTCAAIGNVLALAAVNLVVAVFAAENVVAAAAIDFVVASPTIDIIIAGACDDGIVPSASQNDVIVHAFARQDLVVVVDLVALGVARVAIVDEVGTGCAFDIAVQCWGAVMPGAKGVAAMDVGIGASTCRVARVPVP